MPIASNLSLFQRKAAGKQRQANRSVDEGHCGDSVGGYLSPGLGFAGGAAAQTTELGVVGG
jgi:hypothetical protein